MGKVISFISLKGGVGKTTLCASLAAELANNFSKKVLLIDGNYSAPNLGIHMDIITPGKTVHDVLNGTKMSASIHKKYNVDVVPGNFLFSRSYNPLKLRSKLSFVRKNYDFVIIDSSPTMNDEMLSVIFASDSLFLVSTPDYPTLSCSMKSARLARQRGAQISGMIVNRFIDGNYQISLEEIQESTGIPVVAWIKEDKNVGRSLFERIPMPLYSKKSQFSKEIGKLAAAVSGIKRKPGLMAKMLNLSFKKEDINREILRKDFYTSIFK